MNNIVDGHRALAAFVFSIQQLLYTAWGHGVHIHGDDLRKIS